MHCVHDLKRTKNRLLTNHCFLKVKPHCSKCDWETQMYSRSLSPQVQKLSAANFMCRLAGPFLGVSRCKGSILCTGRQRLHRDSWASEKQSMDMWLTLPQIPSSSHQHRREKESIQGNFIHTFFPITSSAYYISDISQKYFPVCDKISHTR